MAQSLHIGLSLAERERGEPPGVGVGLVLHNNLAEDGNDDVDVESPESDDWHQIPHRAKRVLRSLRDLRTLGVPKVPTPGLRSRRWRRG